MEQAEHPGLALGEEVDQQVAAGDHVEAGEGRIGQHVLHGEHHGSAQLRLDPVAVTLLDEVFRQPLGRDLSGDGFGEEPVAGRGDGVGVDVGGEDLEHHALIGAFHEFAEQDDQRIGLLAGAASRDPDADRLPRQLGVHQVGDDFRGDQIEDAGVAEKAGDVDQQVLGQQVEFAGVGGEHFEVVAHRTGRDAAEDHAPFDPAFQGALLVEGEIIVGAAAHQGDDVLEGVVDPGIDDRDLAGRVSCQEPQPFVQRVGDRGEGEDVVDRAGEDRAAGHAVVGGFLRFLGDDEAAAASDRLQSGAAIRPGAGEDDPDGAGAAGFSEADEEEINRQAGTVAGERLGQVQRAAADRQIGAGRDDIEMLALHRHAVGGLVDGERGGAGEQTGQHAFVARVEMLDQNEGHAGLRR